MRCIRKAFSSGAQVPLISRFADDYLWNEFVACRDCGVPLKPLCKEEVLHAVRSAWPTRNRAAVSAPRRAGRIPLGRAGNYPASGIGNRIG